MSVFDETWGWDGAEDVVMATPTGGIVIAMVGGGPSASEARATLATAAPELYRALASIEFARFEDGGEIRCPSCGRCEHAVVDGRRVHRLHDSACNLDAALKKARGA